MQKFMAFVAGVVAAAALIVQGLSEPVGASVANPGSVTFVIDALSISIGSTTASYDASAAPGCSDGADDGNDTDTLVDYPADPQCTSASDDSETKAGAQPHIVPKFVGTITGAGAISVPTSGATMPVFYIENSSAGGDGVVTVTPRVAQTVTGTANPETGALSMRVRMVVDLDATNLPTSCAIGTSSAPIDMASLSTSSSGGVAYSTATGAARITDHTYAIPGTSGCSFFGSAINDALGVPSASGNNHATFDLHTTPVLTPGAASTSSSSSSSTSTTIPSGSTTSTTRAPTTTTTRPTYTWPWQTTSTTRQTTTTTTVLRTTTTTGRPPVTTTTTTSPSWWCWWC